MSRGFTLIEVLVALSITTMVFAVVAGLIPSFLKTSEDLTRRIQSEDALQSCLAILCDDLRGVDPRLLVGRSDDLKLQTPSDRIAIPTSHGLWSKRGMWQVVYRLRDDGFLLRAETDDLAFTTEDHAQELLKDVESLVVTSFPDPGAKRRGASGIQVRLLVREGSEKRLLIQDLLLDPGKVVKK